MSDLLYGDVPGWSHPGELEALIVHAATCPGPWVEIGSYCGRSAVALGKTAQNLGHVVFAVDPHRGNPEMDPGEACHDPDVWARDHGSLSVLIDTIRGHDLEGVVVPVVAPGDVFAQTGIRPGFVFIDADHSYAGCKADFDTWSQLLADGGILAMHDTTDRSGPGRVRDEAIAAGWRHVEQVKSLAVLTR